MRILTVRQPWAWAIIHGGKNVENRVRNIAGAYRGPVAIHAGLEVDIPALTDPMVMMAVVFKRLDVGAGHPETFKQSPRGAIIGVVDLVGAHVWDAGADASGDIPCSKWAQTPSNLDRPESIWHLELANPRALPEPIPFKGALGLRTLDDETTARIKSAIA